jgi:hypothetical protein
VPIADWTLPDDQVSLPVPGFGSVVGCEGALVDRQHRLLEPWSTPVQSLLCTAMIATGTQRRSPVRR